MKYGLISLTLSTINDIKDFAFILKQISFSEIKSSHFRHHLNAILFASKSIAYVVLLLSENREFTGLNLLVVSQRLGTYLYASRNNSVIVVRGLERI